MNIITPTALSPSLFRPDPPLACVLLLFHTGFLLRHYNTQGVGSCSCISASAAAELWGLGFQQNTIWLTGKMHFVSNKLCIDLVLPQSEYFYTSEYCRISLLNELPVGSVLTYGCCGKDSILAAHAQNPQCQLPLGDVHLLCP